MSATIVGPKAKTEVLAASFICQGLKVMRARRGVIAWHGARRGRRGLPLARPRARPGTVNGCAAGCISTAASRVSAWIIPTEEERMIARYTSQAVTA